MYEDLIQYLEKRYKKKYTALEVEHLADSILIENNPAELVAPTPIVKIVSDFRFKAFKIENLGEDISGNIYIGGTTEKVFHHDKVIVSNFLIIVFLPYVKKITLFLISKPK